MKVRILTHTILDGIEDRIAVRQYITLLQNGSHHIDGDPLFYKQRKRKNTIYLTLVRLRKYKFENP